MADDKRTDPYHFNPDFERAVVTLCARSSRFWGRIGRELEEGALGCEPAKLVIKACVAIATDVGHGPDSPTLVIQRLCRWRTEGKVSQEQINLVSDYLDAAEDAGLPGEEATVQELVPVIRRRLEAATVKTAITTLGKRGDLLPIAATLERAARLGANDLSGGLRLGVGTFQDLDRLKSMQRMPTGIVELDLHLNGGLVRGGLGCWVGGTGEGKSIALTQCAAEGMLAGMHVGVVTLELDPATWMARLIANATGQGIDPILLGGTGRDQAMARMQEMAGSLGPVWVEEFAAQATTVPEILDWVKGREDQEGRAMDVLVVDYADKVAPHKLEGSEYLGMRTVYECLRVQGARQAKRWVWTASAAKIGSQKSNKKRNRDAESAADSGHKGRVVDMMLTLNLNQDTGDLDIYLAKHRQGPANLTAGPLPTDYARGMITPVSR